MKWIRIFVIIVLLALVAFSAADIIDPNTESNNGTTIRAFTIKHCFVIENANQYPGYIFGLYALPHPGGGFVSFEHLYNCWDGGYHLAMPKISTMDRTRYYQLVQNKSYSEVEDTSIISSNYYVYVAKAAKAENRASRTDVLTITTLNSTHLVVKNSRAFYTNLDGHTEEIPLDNTSIKTTPVTAVPTVPVPSPSLAQTTKESNPSTQTLVPATTTSVPVPSDNQNSNDENPLTIYQYFLLPLLAVCVIAAILIRRYKK